MQSCKRLRHYIETQLQAVQEDEDFQRHKWYKSEEAHQDIGFRAALQSFASLPQYRQFAREFRMKYCSQLCEFRSECRLWEQQECPKAAKAVENRAQP